MFRIAIKTSPKHLQGLKSEWGNHLPDLYRIPSPAELGLDDHHGGLEADRETIAKLMTGVNGLVGS